MDNDGWFKALVAVSFIIVQFQLIVAGYHHGNMADALERVAEICNIQTEENTTD